MSFFLADHLQVLILVMSANPIYHSLQVSTFVPIVWQWCTFCEYGVNIYHSWGKKRQNNLEIYHPPLRSPGQGFYSISRTWPGYFPLTPNSFNCLPTVLTIPCLQEHSHMSFLVFTFISFWFIHEVRFFCIPGEYPALSVAGLIFLLLQSAWGHSLYYYCRYSDNIPPWIDLGLLKCSVWSWLLLYILVASCIN